MDKQMNSLEEVLDHYLSIIPADSVQKIKTRFASGETIKNIAASTHLHGGMAMRNSLNLWRPESAKLRQDIWNWLTPEKQKFYKNWWAKHGHDFTGPNMHADDASATIIEALITKIVES